jgi:hypothetical protein
MSDVLILIIALAMTAIGVTIGGLLLDLILSLVGRGLIADGSTQTNYASIIDDYGSRPPAAG